MCLSEMFSAIRFFLAVSVAAKWRELRWSASLRATAGATDSDLPPKAPPLARGEAGTPPGSHQEASVSR